MKGSEFKAKIVEFRKYEKLGIIVRDTRLPFQVDPLVILGINPEENIIELEGRVSINALLIVQLMRYFESDNYVFEFIHEDNAEAVKAEREARIKALEEFNRELSMR